MDYDDDLDVDKQLSKDYYRHREYSFSDEDTERFPGSRTDSENDRAARRTARAHALSGNPLPIWSSLFDEEEQKEEQDEEQKEEQDEEQKEDR